MTNMQRTLGSPTKPRFPSRNERFLNGEEESFGIMACEGKHLATGTSRTRAEKIRLINLQAKDQG